MGGQNKKITMTKDKETNDCVNCYPGCEYSEPENYSFSDWWKEHGHKFPNILKTSGNE